MARLMLVLLAAVVSLTGSASTAQAVVCGEAIVFNLSITHLSGAEVTQANPAQMGEVIRNSVTICPEMSWTDNYGNSKWGNAYFDRGVDQGTHQWIVTAADSSQKQATVWVATASPPPPPPPPPPHNLPYEYTCCETVSVDPVQLLNSGGGKTCWKATAKYGSGLWPYKRVTVQRMTTWCANATAIISHSVTAEHEVSDFGFCSKHSGPKTTKLSGGNGTPFVEYRSQVWFSCNIGGLPWPTYSTKWLEMRYSRIGTAVMPRFGS